MNFAALLGKQLKDDDVIDVLEAHDMAVTYDFDRSHEGQDDVYWSSAEADGFQFRFDQHQRLETIFLYVIAGERFSPVDASTLGFPLHASFDDAQAAFDAAGVAYRQSQGQPGSPMYKWWIKGDFGAFTRHYQYEDGQLYRVSLSVKTDD